MGSVSNSTEGRIDIFRFLEEEGHPSLTGVSALPFLLAERRREEDDLERLIWRRRFVILSDDFT